MRLHVQWLRLTEAATSGRDTPLFRHAPISLLIRGLQGNCYFCIFLFIVFLFSYLIPTDVKH